ncbi:MAG: protein-L-isoaspartate(D-aspartate) O-methyltransferase [Bacteroidia bacterium]
MQLIDSFRHQGLRRKLIDELRLKGIKDEKVLEAMYKVPRHFFMDNTFLEFAYQDKAFPIEAGQTISQPYTVAFQTQLLQIEKGQKILEIGTGSGYQACILEKMGAKVFTIERHKALFQKTKKLLGALNSNIKTFFGDGFKGIPAFAPFDKIIITCGAPSAPIELLKQLKTSGLMAVPVGGSKGQTMTTIIKKDEQHHEIIELGRFNFVPMLKDKVN